MFFIRPAKGWVPIDLGELFAYRGLLYVLTSRDIKVRYKQTLIGIVWAIAQPVFMMLVFSLFFGILARVSSGDIPYPLFTYSALLPWTFFANGVTRASNSLVLDANLIQKVYFPRIILPLAGIISALIDFIVAFVFLLVLMPFFGHLPQLTLIWIIPLLILEFILALGLGLWFSAINVEYRDVGYVIPFFLQLLLFVSPVVYSSSLVPTRFQVLYGIINPMSGIIEGFRWAILGTVPPNYSIVVSFAISLLILVSGMYYFRRREKLFADVV